MNGLVVSVPIETDGKGYIDRQCPNTDCQFIFKMNEEDWENIAKDAAVWCPLCRYEAPSDQWSTFEQVEHAQAQAEAVFREKVDRTLRSSAQRLNRRQTKNNLISISMNVSGSPKRAHVIPAKAAELMQLEIQCERCNSRESLNNW